MTTIKMMGELFAAVIASRTVSYKKIAKSVLSAMMTLKQVGYMCCEKCNFTTWFEEAQMTPGIIAIEVEKGKTFYTYVVKN